MDFKSLPGNADYIWEAPWWAGPERLHSGSASGTQAQESWHRHKLKKYLGNLRTSVPVLTRQLQAFVATHPEPASSKGRNLARCPHRALLRQVRTPSRNSPACTQLHSPKSLPLASSPSLTRRSESFAVQRTTYRLCFVSWRPMSLLPLVHRREHVGVVLAQRMQRIRRTWTCCAICAMSSACVAPANTCASLSLMQPLFPSPKRKCLADQGVQPRLLLTCRTWI